jgi:hypothetical protein
MSRFGLKRTLWDASYVSDFRGEAVVRWTDRLASTWSTAHAYRFGINAKSLQG